MNKKAIMDAIISLSDYDAKKTGIIRNGFIELNMIIDWLMDECFPYGVKFQIDEYEEEDENGNDITIKEYYLIDNNTKEIYDLENEEKYKIFREALKGYEW